MTNSNNKMNSVKSPISNKNFYIAIAIISLIIIMGFGINIYVKYKKYKELEDNTVFPPWPSKCPDYWNNLGDNECENTYKLGKCKTTDNSTMKFTGMPWENSNKEENIKGRYYKCNWAKSCNIPWEGIDSLC